MPVPARATLGLQLRPPGAASARRRGSAAFGRTARPPRASAEPEEERVYVAPNWVSWAPLPASPAAGNRSDALATPPAASPGVPSAGLARLSRAEAAGIVMAAAFGLGAPLPSAEQDPVVPIPLSTSPRRTRLLSFSCNLCGQRTLRRVNPVALETGTTFVQCSNTDCLVYHKLVDNLGLFHELEGPVYPPRAAPRPPGLQSFTRSGGVDILGLDAPAWPAE